MIVINKIMIMNCDLRCKTGFVVKGEPVQIIRIRDNDLVDVINLRNQLIFKVPINCLLDFNQQ